MGIRGLPSRLREEVRIFMGREGNPSEVEETKSRSSQQTVQATEESGIRSVMGERRGRGPESHAPRGIGQTLQGSFERLYRSQNLQASMRLNMRLKALAGIYAQCTRPGTCGSAPFERALERLVPPPGAVQLRICGISTKNTYVEISTN